MTIEIPQEVVTAFWTFVAALFITLGAAAGAVKTKLLTVRWGKTRKMDRFEIVTKDELRVNCQQIHGQFNEKIEIQFAQQTKILDKLEVKLDDISDRLSRLEGHLNQ